MKYDLNDDCVSDPENLLLDFWTIKVGFGFSLHFSLLWFCQVHLRNIIQDFMTEILTFHLHCLSHHISCLRIFKFHL